MARSKARRLTEAEVVAALDAAEGVQARAAAILDCSAQGLAAWLKRRTDLAARYPAAGRPVRNRGEGMRALVAALHASAEPLRVLDLAATAPGAVQRRRAIVQRALRSLRASGVVEQVAAKGPWRLTDAARAMLATGIDPIPTDRDRTDPSRLLVWIDAQARAGRLCLTSAEVGRELFGEPAGLAGRRGSARMDHLRRAGYVTRVTREDGAAAWQLTDAGRERAAEAEGGPLVRPPPPPKQPAPVVRWIDDARAIDVARAHGIPDAVYYGRIRDGWTTEEAATEPADTHARLKIGDRFAAEVAREHNVPYETFKQRHRTGWALDDAATLPVGSRRPKETP